MNYEGERPEDLDQEIPDLLGGNRGIGLFKHFSGVVI